MSFLPYLCMLFGLLFENHRLGTKWYWMIVKIGLSLLFSHPAMYPFSDESQYDLISHLEKWLLYFSISFIFLSLVAHFDKSRLPLFEGITLIHSLAIAYTIIDFNLLDTEIWFVQFILFMCFVMIIYTVYHAFSYRKHNRSTRLTLSIWSSLMMIVFAAEHLYNVFVMELYSFSGWREIILVCSQYFFLGVSIIYIAYNFLSLATYLPGKGHFYGKEHMKEIKEMNEEHVKNYSDHQISRMSAFITITISASLFYCNYVYGWMPRSACILMLLWITTLKPYQQFLQRIDKLGISEN